MAPLPALKLAAMLLKTISKPLASALLVQAKYNRPLAKVCNFAGQSYHQIHSRVTIFAAGYRVVEIKPLAEDQAMNGGASIVSEGLLLFTAVYEYNVTAKQNALKAQKVAQIEEENRYQLECQFNNINDKINDLNNNINSLAIRLQSFEERLPKPHIKSNESHIDQIISTNNNNENIHNKANESIDNSNVYSNIFNWFKWK